MHLKNSPEKRHCSTKNVLAYKNAHHLQKTERMQNCVSVIWSAEIFKFKIMKNFIVLFFVFTLLAYTAESQPPREYIKGEYLLKTKWGGNDLFYKYSPEKQPLGCHSHAIAQVLNYYKLTPAGKVTYSCSKGWLDNKWNQ